MTGIGNELFLCFHIPDIWAECPSGEDEHKDKYNKQTDNGDCSSDQQERADGLQFTLGIEKNNECSIIGMLNQIAVAILITVFFAMCKSLFCVRSSIVF